MTLAGELMCLSLLVYNTSLEVSCESKNIWLSLQTEKFAMVLRYLDRTNRSPSLKVKVGERKVWEGLHLSSTSCQLLFHLVFRPI